MGIPVLGDGDEMGMMRMRMEKETWEAGRRRAVRGENGYEMVPPKEVEDTGDIEAMLEWLPNERREVL